MQMFIINMVEKKDLKTKIQKFSFNFLWIQKETQRNKGSEFLILLKNFESIPTFFCILKFFLRFLNLILYTQNKKSK